MAFNTPENRNSIINFFPALATDPTFKLTSENVVTYNCIAFAMGFDDRWVQPCSIPSFINRRFYWWPSKVPNNSSESALCEAFEAVGFNIVQDVEFEPNFDKVVLYSLNGEATHASRIVANGIEHSKFGEGWDGQHGSNLFIGTPYGTAFAVMRRPHISTAELIAQFPLPKGSMLPSTSLLLSMLSRKP